MEHIVRITSIENVTHDVKRFRCERPAGYEFHAGQATEVSINREGWKEERRPFSFTCLNEAPYLEFTIKIYPDHGGVTAQLDKLQPGDELIVRDVWGAIEYKGPGYFIAGGAGVTPFIAILRQLQREGRLAGNTLFFSNKTDRDIILESELNTLLGDQVVHIITDDTKTRHHAGYIDEAFLRKHVTDFSRNFYLCGPPKMVAALQDTVRRLHAAPDSVVFEK
ncbi:flavodoxin reductase [Flaviaesturariibacter flavus]|uniref:Flavodoxin reductase n=1 Tax=Flaviaesturariibacter flavus TaxID=2502780 RepID=A0A4R1BC46_9BACT|nr:FAD-binding oxidoreductase [Flaviaesturariibacter flavus]TCJ14606.1 flavodoxin reductase [Flaviaesturariibacter flavus]